MHSNKPFSQACENNKEPILAVIAQVFTDAVTVWEIGSGTGQHASYFAQKLPHLQWQPTDCKQNLVGIRCWVDDTDVTNLLSPLPLDVTDKHWPSTEIEALFTANTLHIMSWQQVEIFFQRLQKVLHKSAVLCIYGPFNYQGSFTSDSNAHFDQWLKARDPASGIRDQEAVVVLAKCAGLILTGDVAMPANNRLLVFSCASLSYPVFKA